MTNQDEELGTAISGKLRFTPFFAGKTNGILTPSKEYTLGKTFLFRPLLLVSLFHAMYVVLIIFLFRLFLHFSSK